MKKINQFSQWNIFTVVQQIYLSFVLLFYYRVVLSEHIARVLINYFFQYVTQLIMLRIVTMGKLTIQ